MEKPLFTATERFDPSDGERWNSYVQWANIANLVEVVSLDGMLCPRILAEIVDEDWEHNVHQDFRLNYFYSLDYVIHRSAGAVRRNILGLYRNPIAHVAEAPVSRPFAFLGYDLIEEATQISVLTNCGGSPNTFSNDELNQYGLITDFSRARDVKRLLLHRNAAEPHARCEMYALWRLQESGERSQ